MPRTSMPMFEKSNVLVMYVSQGSIGYLFGGITLNT